MLEGFLLSGIEILRLIYDRDLSNGLVYSHSIYIIYNLSIHVAHTVERSSLNTKIS